MAAAIPLITLAISAASTTASVVQGADAQGQAKKNEDAQTKQQVDLYNEGIEQQKQQTEATQQQEIQNVATQKKAALAGLDKSNSTILTGPSASGGTPMAQPKTQPLLLAPFAQE
jgi:ribosomal protein L14E/L6E/L27E